MMLGLSTRCRTLSSHLEACFEGLGGSTCPRREVGSGERAQLAREHARVSRMVHTFQSVSRVYSRAAGGGGEGRGDMLRPPRPTTRRAPGGKEPRRTQMATQPTQPPQLSPTQGLSFMRGNGAGA